MNEVENEMARTWLHLPARTRSMLEMVMMVGIAKRVRYSNLQERKVKGGGGTMEVVNIVHDYGLIFNDGTEIKHVSKDIYKYFKNHEVIDKRERI